MTDRTIIEIPLEQLEDSPFNPPDRATLNIAELAASIKAEGRVHSPLLVRPLVGSDDGGYEIVFGHRRRYAAEAAGLATVPCEVRAMSNAEARAAQASENIQRENLKALEESAQYQGMVDGGLTATEVAARIGKSRSHVYGRLRLLDLCPQVRQALQSGEVQGEVALLIARVGDEKMQAKALTAIRNIGGEIRDGGAKSYRRIRELLNEKFTLDLGKAIFPITSAELVPTAGSCTDCRKRTGNAPEFDDVTAEKSDEAREQEEDRLQREVEKAEEAGDDEKAESLYNQLSALHNGGYVRMRHVGANVCTDPDCFEAKKKAHLKAEAKRLEAEGATVIAGTKARQAVNAQGQLAEGFVSADKVDLAKAKGDVKPVTIQNPRDGSTVQAFRAEDLQVAGVKVKAPKVARKAGYDPEHHERERERNRVAAEAELHARMAVLQAVRHAAAGAPRGEFDLRLVARAMIDRLPHSDQRVLGEVYQANGIDELRAMIDGMAPQELGRLLLDCAIVDNVAVDQWSYRHTQPEALLQAAAHYGVDVQAARASVQTPAPEAEPAKNGKLKKGRKPEAQAELV